MRSALYLAALAAGTGDEFVSDSARRASEETAEKLSKTLTGGNQLATGLLAAKLGLLCHQTSVYTVLAAASLGFRAKANFLRDMTGDIAAADKLAEIADSLEKQAVEIGPDFGSAFPDDEDEEIVGTGTEG